MENPTFKTSRPRNNEVCKSIAPHPFEKIDGFPLLSPAIQKNLRQISLDQIELLLPIVKQKILDIKKTVENAREKTKEGAQKKRVALELEIVNGKIINKDNSHLYAEQLANIGLDLKKVGFNDVTARVETVIQKKTTHRIVTSYQTPPLELNLTANTDDIYSNMQKMKDQDCFLRNVLEMFHGISDDSFEKLDTNQLVKMLYMIDDYQVVETPIKKFSFSPRAEKIFIALAQFSNYDFQKVQNWFFDPNGKLQEKKFKHWLKLNGKELEDLDKINPKNLRWKIGDETFALKKLANIKNT